jgi:hypothetical protein
MQYTAAISLLADYTSYPERYWEPPGEAGEHRQVRKLKRSMRATAEAAGTDTATALERVVSLAEERAARRPPPIYVMGLGGSGSHWLAEMLAELLGGIDSAEVYFPSSLLDRMEELPADQQALIVDCLHIAHAYGHPTNPLDRPLSALASARAVNSAAGSIHPRYKRWDPRCFVVHMLRDPRDQVASVTFRKAGYRREVDPDASDDEYLTKKATAAVDNYNAWRDSPIDADFLCRYEELKASSVNTLDHLLAALGEAHQRRRIAEVARRHDAALMKKGLVKPRGNLYLDDGGGSRREPSERQRALLHAALVEVRSAAGYPADDCLGRAVNLPPVSTERELHFPSSDGLGVLFVKSKTEGREAAFAWRRLDRAVGEVLVPGGVILKLRVFESATAEAIESLAALPSHALDSLCLAGNRALDDRLLGLLAESLHDLGELDLARTAISDDGMARLASLQRLRGLSLLDTEVSKQRAEGLRDSFKECALLYATQTTKPV